MWRRWLLLLIVPLVVVEIVNEILLDTTLNTWAYSLGWVVGMLTIGAYLLLRRPRRH